MNSHRQTLGDWGEAIAAQWLSERGYAVVERNLRTPYEEIDLIARKADSLVFVEVKTRTTEAYGLPETSITARKRQHLMDAAQAYLQANPQPRPGLAH